MFEGPLPVRPRVPDRQVIGLDPLAQLLSVKRSWWRMGSFSKVGRWVMKQELSAHETGTERSDRADLVFDFSEIGSPDLGALCLMLTARNIANGDHKRVWLHGLPETSWRMLHAMGLQDYFEMLPFAGDRAN
jgi:hypothetical protein